MCFPGSERGEFDLVGIFVADLVGRVDGLDLRHGDLRIGILDGAVLDDGAVTPSSVSVPLFNVADNRFSSEAVSSRETRSSPLSAFRILGGGRLVMAGPAEQLRRERGMSLDALFREVFRC